MQEILNKERDEEFEMQYFVINIGDIEGDHKLNISKTLKDCDDLELF